MKNYILYFCSSRVARSYRQWLRQHWGAEAREGQAFAVSVATQRQFYGWACFTGSGIHKGWRQAARSLHLAIQCSGISRQGQDLMAHFALGDCSRTMVRRECTMANNATTTARSPTFILLQNKHASSCVTNIGAFSLNQSQNNNLPEIFHTH